MKRDTTGGSGSGGGSGGTHNKAALRKKNCPATADGDSLQPRDDHGRRGVAAPNGPTCGGDEVPSPVGGARVSEDTRGVGEGEQHPPQDQTNKVEKARGPTLEDALDDVQVRFVLNLPEAELSSADRLFFQLEQAWWFYEDFIADAHPHLPHFRLKEFSKLMFSHCKALQPLSGKYNELFEYFRSWVGTIPTAGCILLNATMTKMVLVKSWKGNSRGFPRGKINQGEAALAAAVREVWEETGFDASDKANENDSLSLYLNEHQSTLYIVTDVDEDFPFEPQVRKEVSAVEWFPLDTLPKVTYEVEPFLPRLRRWMAKKRGMPAPKEAMAEARTQSTIRIRKIRPSSPDGRLAATALRSVIQSDNPAGKGSPEVSSRKGARKNKTGGKNGGGDKGNGFRACSAPNRRAKGYDAHNRDTFGGGQEGGGASGRSEGWAFEEMLAANERLTGRTFVYDGNPHEFGEPHQASAPESASASASASVPLPSPVHVAATGPAASPAPAVALAATPNMRRDEKDGQLNQHTASAPEGMEVSGKGQSDRTGSRNTGLTAASANVPADAVGVGARVSSRAGEMSVGARARSEGVRGPQANGPCTERISTDVGRGEGLRGDCNPARWTVVNASPSSSGGGGLFGEFEFDMVDIMSAVPQC